MMRHRVLAIDVIAVVAIVATSNALIRRKVHDANLAFANRRLVGLLDVRPLSVNVSAFSTWEEGGWMPRTISCTLVASRSAVMLIDCTKNLSRHL